MREGQPPGAPRVAAVAPVLAVRDLHGWYGESHVLHGVDLHIGEGELVTLVGRNGAGKSTTIKAIMGVLARRKGSITLHGTGTIRLASHRIARLGAAWCPEERAIFGSLSVEENLRLPPVLQPGGIPVEEIYALFPNLHARRKSQGTQLSGGEQQMLALARILRTGSRLLLLDEITEGLAPIVVEQIGHSIAALRTRGYTILLVEQNLHFAAALADRLYVMESGHIVQEIAARDIAAQAAAIDAHLGL